MTPIEKQQEAVAKAEFSLARAQHHLEYGTVDMFGDPVDDEMLRRLRAGVDLRERELVAAKRTLAALVAARQAMLDDLD